MTSSPSNLFGNIRNQFSGPVQAPHHAATTNEECVSDINEAANLSWLKTVPVTNTCEPFDLKMFSTECADAFISGSRVLEGVQLTDTLKRFKDCYKSALDQMKKSIGKDITVDLSHLDQCQKESDKIAKMIKDQANISTINDHAKALLDHVKTLQRGKSFSFPGGWAGSQSNPMIYQIKKQADGKYSFTIYNTGAGVEFHHGIIADSHNKYQGHLSVNDIEADKIEQTEFFRTLVEPLVIPAINSLVSSGPESVYIGALEYLGGKVEAPVDFEKHPEHFMKPQRAGTSAMKILYSVLRRAILENEGRLDTYKQIKFFYKRQSLVDMCHLFFKNGTAYDRTTHKQISQVASGLARTARKLSKDGLLPAKVLKECEATILDIQQKIKTKKERFKSTKIEEKLSFDISSRSSNLSAYNPYQQTQSIYNNTASPKISEVSPIHLPKESEIKTDNVSGLLKKSLDSINMHLEKPNASTLQSLDSLISLMRLLPAPTKSDSDFWNKVPESSIESILGSLQKLTQCAFRAGTPKTPTTETIIALYTALAISDKLARRNKDNHLDGFNLEYNKLVTLSETPHIRFASPKSHIRLKELLEYWNTEIKLDEKMPDKTLKDALEAAEKNSWFFLDKFSTNRFVSEYSLSQNAVVGLLKKLFSVKDERYKFFKELLSTKEIKEKIDRSPVKGKPLLDIIAYLEAEKMGPEAILPPQIHYLRQISLACSMSAEGINPQVEHKNFQFAYKDFRTETLLSSRESRYLSLDLVALDLDNSAPQKRESSIYRQSSLPLPLGDSPEELKKFSVHFEGNPQNKIMRKYLLEEDRDVRLLDTNAADEIARTLAYYTSRPNSLFTDTTHQFIFESHILRPDRLHAAMTQEPRLAIKLLKFINQRIDYFNSANQWRVALYFAELGQNCQKQIQCLVKKHEKEEAFSSIKSALNDAYKDYRQIIVDEILLKRKEPLERSEIYLALGGLYSATEVDDFNSTKIEISKDLILSSILLPIAILQNPKLAKAGNHMNEQHQMTQVRHLPNIIKLLDENATARNEILSYVISGIKNQNMSMEWEGKHPLFHTKDRQYSVDLSKGIASENNRPFAGIPAAVIEHETFKKLFKNVTAIHVDPLNNFKLKIDHDGISSNLEYSDLYTRHPEYLNNDTLRRHYTLKVTRDIEGRTYEYIPYKRLDDSLSRSIPFSFLDPSDKTTTIWYSQPNYLVESDDGKKYTINITNDTSSSYYYPSSFKNINIETTSDFSKRKKILIDPQGFSGIDVLQRFERKEHIGCWKYANQNKVCEVSLARFGLSFQVRNEGGEDRAYCKEIPGYYIASDQDVEFKGRCANYLCVVNSEGKRRIIIPKDQYQADVKAAENVYDPLLSTQSTERKLDYLVFDIVETDGVERLKATSVHDNLFLVYLLASKKQYKQALYYLSQSHSLSPYSKKDLEVIEWILKSTDMHPSANLLHLKLIIMLEENRLKYALESDETIKKELWMQIGYKYSSYLNNIHNTTLDKLSLEEEKSFLRMLQSRDLILLPVISQRLTAVLSPDLKHKTREIRNKARELPAAAQLSSIGERMLVDLLIKDRIYGFELDSMPIIALSNQEFEKALPNLYTIARHGSDSDKKKLKKILSLMEGSPMMTASDRSVALSCLIRNVIASPSNFPSTDELENAKTLSYNDPGYNIGQTQRFENRKAAYEKLIKHGSAPDRERSLLKDFKVVAQLLAKIDPLKTVMLENGLIPKDDEINKLLFGLPEIQKLDDDTSTVMAIDPGVINTDTDWDAYFQALEPNIDRAIKSLSTCINATKDLIKREIISVESRINTFPKHVHVDEHLKLLGKQKRKLSFQDAVDLFEEGKMSRYKEFVHMGDSEIQDLDTTIGRTLIEVTRLAQAQQLLEFFNLINDPAIENEERDAIIQKKDDLLNTKRAHLTNGEGKRSRSYLVFEARNRIILREKQVDNLDSFIDHKDPMQLLEVLGTGSGKSKILAPMKQWLRRDRNRLIFNLWPSALYEVNRDDIKEQISESYRTRGDTFEFDRATDTSLINLVFMNREIRKAINEMRQLSAKPESTQSCELKLLEVLHKIAFEKMTFPENTVSSLQKILKMMLEAEAHVDEGHKNFSPRREVNFTIGDPKIESLKHIALIEKMYELIITDKDLVNIIRLESNQQHLMLEEDYIKTVAPRIAEKLSGYLGIKDNQKQEYLDYVLGKKQSLPSWVESHERKQEISLLRGELVFILPQTLGRCTGVHYGLSKEKPSIEYAKPYDANDSCVEKAEYDNIHEALNKTYQTYLHGKLSLDQQWKLVSHLQTEALLEEKKYSKDRKETAAYKFFQKNFPKGIPDLFALDKLLLETWVSDINKNNVVIFYYIKTLIAPTIKKYKFKLKSDSQNFRSQFKNVMTMTATPGSEHAYGPKMETRPDLGNDELIGKALETKCKDPESVQIIKQSQPRKIVEEIVNTLIKTDTDARMLIDIGALFKGISNRDVAQIIFNRFKALNSDVRGVVFFENNKLVVMEGENQIVPLEQSQLKPKDRFSYCDNKHMFGADIKQFPTARAICTFDNTIDLDDMVQGVGRLREFLKGQTVSWVLTEESAKVLKPGYGKNNRITFDTLKKQAENNLELRKADDNYRSLKQQMRNEIRSVCIKKIVEAKSDKDALDLFKKFYTILVDEVCDEPFLLYGQIEKIVTGYDSLHNYRKKTLEKLETIEGLENKEKESIRTNLRSYEKKINDLKDKLPKEVKEFNAELGTESEVQQNVDSDVETAQETQTNDTEGLHNREVSKWPTKFDMYKGIWFKPVATSLLLHNLFMKLRSILGACARYALSPTTKTLQWALGFKFKVLPNTTIAELPIIGIAYALRQTKGIKSKMSTKAKVADAADLLHDMTTKWTATNQKYFSAKVMSKMAIVGFVGVINLIAIPILAVPVLVIFGTPYVLILLARSAQTCVQKLFGSVNSQKVINQPIPIYSASDVVKMNPDPDITKATALFKDTPSQQLRMTNNFVTLRPASHSDPSVKPLGKEQKSINEILIIEDTLKNGKKQLTFIVGDQSTDAAFWRKELANDRANATAKDLETRKRKICLYDMRLGIVSDSKNRFNEDDLMKSRDFQEMIVKLKLFNADVDYTEDQEAILKKWAQDEHMKKTIKGFFSKAMAWHDVKKKGFGHSIIHALFS
jgi:hypothetical protein